VLHFIREGKPIAFQDVVNLWERTQNYEMLETIVDIAVDNHMPLWAAEQQYRKEWNDYQQSNANPL
jgi:hypothetical protein